MTAPLYRSGKVLPFLLARARGLWSCMQKELQGMDVYGYSCHTIPEQPILVVSMGTK